MDFNIVKRQIIAEYISLYGDDRQSNEWSLASCLAVFRYFYIRYRQTTGRDHPHLSSATINRIIQDFPYLAQTSYDSIVDLSPEDYPTLIDSYFDTDFPNCNYSIAHFMSGNIRALRYYEKMYYK